LVQLHICRVKACLDLYRSPGLRRYQIVNTLIQHAVANIHLLCNILVIHKNIQSGAISLAELILQLFIENSIQQIQTLRHLRVSDICSIPQVLHSLHWTVKHILQQLRTGTADGKVYIHIFPNQSQPTGSGIDPHIDILPHRLGHYMKEHDEFHGDQLPQQIGGIKVSRSTQVHILRKKHLHAHPKRAVTGQTVQEGYAAPSLSRSAHCVKLIAKNGSLSILSPQSTECGVIHQCWRCWIDFPVKLHQRGNHNLSASIADRKIPYRILVVLLIAD